MKFCSLCGRAGALQVPEDDNRERHVCQNCGAIHYVNPKVIVSCLPLLEMFCCASARLSRAMASGHFRRALWKMAKPLPMAPRETWEEAAAKATDLTLYHISMCPTSVRYICSTDAESITTSLALARVASALFSEEEIPWDELAFPTVRELLKEFLLDRQAVNIPFVTLS